MYTVEEIKNITFTKTLGGYKTGEVDDFIDVCADTVEALTKQNEDLKKKMEVLANKIVEYRNDEDSIRTALLSAQRMGDTVLREANHKAGLILEDAKIKAEKIEEVAKQQIAEELKELERIKKLVSDFKTQVLGVYREHLSMIDVLPDYKEPEEEKDAETEDMEEDTPVEPQEQPVEEQVEMPVAKEELAAEIPDAPLVSVDEETAEEEQVNLFGVEEASVENTRFSGLKFGADYDISDDTDDDEPADKKRGKRKLF